MGAPAGQQGQVNNTMVQGGPGQGGIAGASGGGGKGGGTNVSQNSGMPMSMVGQGGPNVYQQAAAGVTGGMMGTAGEMGYQPMQVQAGTGQAAMAGSTGYDAAQAGATGYNAAMAGSQAPINAQDVQAGQIGSTDLSQYFNPYENQVVQNTLADINLAGLGQQNALEAQASQAGAFGGSRHGVALSNLGSDLTRQSAQAAAQLRQAGFQNAQQMAGQDIASRMQADLANQGANLQAATTNANLGQQVNLSNQAAANAAGQFGAGAMNQASLSNQAALNTAGQFGAGAANQAALQNQGAANAMTQFNLGNQLTAQQANQNAGLQGSQNRLGAANQLAQLGNLGFGMGQDIQAGMAQSGALQQATQQAIIDQAKNQWQAYTGMPAETIGYLSQALGATTVPQSQQTTKQLGLMDYLSAGTAMMGSDKRLKKNIKQLGSLDNGMNIYRWEWNELAGEFGLEGESVGVIAQEAADIMPDAVIESSDGYLLVDYSKVLEVAA